jgi:uncharacterized protein YraI
LSARAFKESDMVSRILTSAAFAAAVLAPGAASAQSSATATTDLNVRAGPGPQYPIVGYIEADDAVTVTGCLDQSQWCTVDFAGGHGWAYSAYLVTDLSGAPVVVAERRAEIGVPVTTYEGTDAVAGGAAGMATGAIAGAIVAGPVGAAVGALAGGAVGMTAGEVIDPPAEVRTFVTANAVEPVYLEGEVVVGATVPEPVALQPIPDYQYRYVYLNGQPVLVDPGSRQIVYVVR